MTIISMGSVVGIKNDRLLIGRFRYLSYDFSKRGIYSANIGPISEIYLQIVFEIVLGYFMK